MKNIKFIAAGHRHNIAIDNKGTIWGWGYNNQQQLSHSQEFADDAEPRFVLFEPTPITHEIEDKRGVMASCGEDFTILVTEDRDGVQEVWSTGNNLRGQLGNNRTSHICDISRIDDISGFTDSQRATPIKVSHIQCGRKHSIITFDYGAFFIWGDNEFGQLGDRKRRVMESPFPKAKFELKHNVLNVTCNHNSCAVVVERLPEGVRDKDNEDKKLEK